MGKNKKLRQKINAFVSQLTPDEIREQLALAYMQMERCKRVLRGEDVEPVDMRDNGISSDLELFYACKKNAEELSALNEVASKPEGKSIEFSIDIDTEKATKHVRELGELMKKVAKEFGKGFVVDHNKLTVPKATTQDFPFKIDLTKYYPSISSSEIEKRLLKNIREFNEPEDEYFRVVMKYIPKSDVVEFSFSEGLQGFAIDVDTLKKFMENEVDGKRPPKVHYAYFLNGGRIHKGEVVDVIGLEMNDPNAIVRIKGRTGVYRLDQVFENPEDSIKRITIQDHISYHKGEDYGYFIDSTNRVFRAAEWYLQDQKIQHFSDLDALRKYLIENIVEDGTGEK